MNILRFELKRNFRAFLIWTLSITVFAVYMMSLYGSSFAGMGKGIEQFMHAFPDSLRRVFGMDRLDLTTVTGYFGMEVHLMIILFGAIYAVLLSSSLLSKEESEKTVEFLLARPVTRAQVVTQKLLTFVVYVTLYTAVTWVASYASILAFGKRGFDGQAFWLLGGMTFLAIMVMAVLGFLGSIFVTHARGVYSAALVLVLGLYAAQIVTAVSRKMSFLGYVTPFKWANAADILPQGKVDWVYVALALVVIAAGVAGSYWAYGRKDLAG